MLSESIAVATAVLLAAVPWAVADKPEEPDPTDQLKGPITTRKVNGGTLAHRYLQDKGGGQDAAVWIADETKLVRGILLHLHQGKDAWRTDFQEFCRSQDFALAGSLIRWDGFERVLPDQITQLGKALGHPEIANVPWACIGGSRNVGALLNFSRLREDRDHRILCLLFSGGPGTGLRLDRGGEREMFAGIPMMAVNGSADPFVAGMAWQKKQYPRIRSHDMPYGVAVDWQCGHAPEEAGEMWYPFVEAVIAHRYPENADPRKGQIRLKPFAYEDGWLVGPVNWEDTWGPKAAPVAKWQGATKNTVWLPDETCVEIWRAFQSLDTAAAVRYDGNGTLRLIDVPAHGYASVEFVADGQVLGKTDSGPFDLQTDKLATGCWSVWARCTRRDGTVEVTQTTLVINGKEVDYRAGKRAAQLVATPLRALQVDDEVKQTLQALAARRDQADAWKLAFQDDFDGGIKDAWYNYYKTERVKRPRGHENDRQTNVDGTMQLYSDLHAVAMLPYDWPEEVAVEYRARAVSRKVCDMSVVLSGNAGGTDFPWRAGMMFQFGAHFNQGSFFLVHEQPHRNWKPYDSGARIQPGKWHRIRVERLDGEARAYVDGKRVNTRALSPHDFERFYGQKIGLYTFQSTVQFDDVRIYVRGHSGQSPPLPPAGKLDAAVRVLLTKLSDPFAQQRNSAWRLLREYSWELGDALERALQAGQIGDAGARKRVERILAGRRPDKP